MLLLLVLICFLLVGLESKASSCILAFFLNFLKVHDEKALRGGVWNAMPAILLDYT